MSFGARMRHERERRKISIAAIADSTKILGALLEGMENDDVSRWPTGFYRRAFMRAYANAIGLDPNETLKEFLERFPEPEDSSTPEAGAARSGHVASATGKDGGPERSRGGAAPGLRVTAPPAGAWFSDGTLVQGIGLRLFAAAVDLFVVSVMGLALYAVLGTFWAPFALATVTYYCGGILLLGNTPGVCLFADPARTTAAKAKALAFLTDQKLTYGGPRL